LLTSHFLKEAATRFERVPAPLSADAYALLLRAPWSGNVRELKNVIEAAVLATGPEIQAADLQVGQQHSNSTAPSIFLFKEAKQQVIDTFERDFITRALRRHHNNITKAAEEMGMLRQQLQQKIRELGLRAWEEGNTSH
jgi:DNA-binding NtrC family response regulator